MDAARRPKSQMGRVEVTNLAETYSPAPKYLYTIKMCISFFFEKKNIYLGTLVQDVATETRPAFPDSSKFLQVFRNQNFCKFATALEPRGLPENKQMLISGIYRYTFCFCPLLLLFSLSIPHQLKYSSLATCNRANITKQRCQDMSFIIVIIIVIIIVSTN